MKKTITLLSMTAGLLMGSSQAQIIHTELSEPLVADYSVAEENTQVLLDINEDGTDDFHFEVGHLNVLGDNLKGVLIYAYEDHQIASDEYSDVILGFPVSFNQVLKYEADETIDGTANFQGNSNLGDANGQAFFGTCGFCQVGHFEAFTDDFYFAVKLTIDGAAHYGWVKANVDTETLKISILSYAYQTEAETAIKAGQTEVETDGLSIEENQLDWNIYPNPGTDIVHINSANTQSQTVEVFHLSGKKVFESTFQNNISITTENWNKGHYIIRVGAQRKALILH